MLIYYFLGRYRCVALLFCLLFCFFQMQGQESVERITVKDVTPRASLKERLQGSFFIAPYYAGNSGAGAVAAYAVKDNFSFTGNFFSSDEVSRILLKARYLFKVSQHSSLGPSIGYSRIKWKGTAVTDAYSLGGEWRYDTRDNAAAPSQGVYFSVKHNNYTDFSSSPYFGTVMQLDSYAEVWDGGVLAGDLYAEFMYGSVPWNMLATVGDSQRMRGYPVWEYRDNNAACVQVELRQRVWTMFSAVAWAAGAVLWGEYNKFSADSFLPNAGVGVRCALLDNLSIRIDWGIGKNGQSGFVIGINEAF